MTLENKNMSKHKEKKISRTYPLMLGVYFFLFFDSKY